MATKEPGRATNAPTTPAGTGANGTTPGAGGAPAIPELISDPEKLLRRAAMAERRLLDRERRAERTVQQSRERLSDAETKLGKARERVIRRQAELDEAVAILRERQRSRAGGPLAELTGGSEPDAAAAPVVAASDGDAPRAAADAKPRAAAKKVADRPAAASSKDGSKPAARRRKPKTAAS